MSDDIYNDNDSIPEAAPRPTPRKAPTEFAGFIRDTLIGALDHYASRVATTDVESEQQRAPKPVRKIADHWLTLEPDQKVRFFDQVIGAAEMAIAAAPVAIATLREKKRRRAEAEDAEAPAATKKAAPKKKKAAPKNTSSSATTKKASSSKKSSSASDKPKNKGKKKK